MESVWNCNGKDMEKIMRSKLGEMEWNWNGTIEWKWNGIYSKKFGDEKWNGNRKEMERNWNGKCMKKFVDANRKWEQSGNGMEME